MEIPVIQIGNSKGIRLSSALLKQYNIREKIELHLTEDSIILKAIAPTHKPRKNWGKAFKKMHTNGDNTLLMDDVFLDEDWA